MESSAKKTISENIGNDMVSVFYNICDCNFSASSESVSVPIYNHLFTNLDVYYSEQCVYQISCHADSHLCINKNFSYTPFAKPYHGIYHLNHFGICHDMVLQMVCKRNFY